MKRSFLTLLFLLSFSIFTTPISAADYNFSGSYGDTFIGSTGGLAEIPAQIVEVAPEESPPRETLIIPSAPEVWSAQNAPSVSNKFTLPDGIIGADGRLGTLKIPKIDLTVAVYEEESLESMRRGAGHFKSTSCWNGLVGLAGHNRGTNAYFGRLKELAEGDEIFYETVLGEKMYKVKTIQRISETDWSVLQRSETDRIALVTCVEDMPSLRLCVLAESGR
jgi:sortase A